MAIGAIVVVAVLVLVLALVGVIPIFSSSSSSSGTAITYDQARPLADSAAQGTSGGSWALVVSAGIMSSTVATENLGPSGSSGSSGCNVTTLSGASTNVTVPAGPANQTRGTAMGWLFMYRNAAEELLIVTVIAGKGSAVATIAAGQSCSSIFGLLGVVPSDAIDSSVVANDVASDAAAFLTAHPDANAAYSLLGGVSFLGFGVGAEWRVNYTTCPVGSTTGTTGAAFNATLNATTGAVIYHQTLAQVTCTNTGGLSLGRATTPAAPLERAVGPLAVARRN